MTIFRKPSRRSIGWIIAAALAGMLLVLLAFNLMGGEKKIERQMSHLYPLSSPQFAKELGVLLGPPFIGGNRVEALLNGDQIFPSMLSAIRQARSTITFETYIYWSGDIGREFADALVERSSSGVKVHVLLDWIGSAKMDDEVLARLEAAKIEVRKFHPPHWSHLSRMNNRTHRKLLVVDGKVAFTGGVGIATQWTGNAQDPDHWRDTHFRIEGPVVAQIQSVFLDNWVKVTGKVLNGEKYFPELRPVGDAAAQMFSSSPSGGSESMQLMYLMAITASTRSIDISAAYFVPDELMTTALVAAMKRGVRLRLVLPGEHIDSDAVRNASRAGWGPLLEGGATIAEYRPTMYHCKVMIVDNRLVSVGSTNFDNRSFRLNDEATLNVLDADFAAAQTKVFEDDLARSKPITLAQWRDRPLRGKAIEHLTSLLNSQL